MSDDWLKEQMAALTPEERAEVEARVKAGIEEMERDREPKEELVED